MRRLLAGAAALLAAGAWAAQRGAQSAAPAATDAAKPKPVRLVRLQNADFELDPPPAHNCAPRWGCKVHSDPTAYQFAIDEASPFEGRRSLRIERVRNEPWALATQAVVEPALRDRRLRFTLAVRVDGAEGEGGGPWVLVHGTRGNLLNEHRLVKGTQGWQRISIEFPVGAEAQMVEVGATLEGPGRMWIDDARLEMLP